MMKKRVSVQSLVSAPLSDGHFLSFSLMITPLLATVFLSRGRSMLYISRAGMITLLLLGAELGDPLGPESHVQSLAVSLRA